MKTTVKSYGYNEIQGMAKTWGYRVFAVPFMILTSCIVCRRTENAAASGRKSERGDKESAETRRARRRGKRRRQESRQDV